MNKKQLKVLISGTGFAGQGHADAFRNVGVEVVGMVGRTESVLAEVAKKKSIACINTDWEQALMVKMRIRSKIHGNICTKEHIGEEGQ